jgi:hypothetical protein
MVLTSVLVGAIAFGCTSSATESELLDGTKPIEARPLADLARDRAILGARWLANVVRDDGRFYYQYDADRDVYEEQEYNEVRHAGTVWGLFMATGATGDAELKDAAIKAASFIEANSVAMAPGRAYMYEGQLSLGGQALAIIALLEGRRVLGDDRYDSLVGELAEFLLSLELPDQPGRYVQWIRGGQRISEPIARFFPGESLLALSRLAQHFPDAEYLAAAKRAAHFLIKVKDGDITADAPLRDVDHWLPIALSDLHRLAPEPDYELVVARHADPIPEALWHADDGFPARIGATRTVRISYTTTATQGEAMVAAWALARRTGNEDATRRWSEAAQRIAQFEMRVQFAGDNTQLFPKPTRVNGGWANSVGSSLIQIDFVQHNLGSLLGLWYVSQEGELPAP